jgi:DNA replication protein DnaC
MSKTPPISRDAIQGLLRELKLGVIEGALDEVLDRATRQKQPVESVLVDLFTRERDALLERRISRRIKEAKLPELKLLDDYDFTFQTGVDERIVKSLATLDFVARRQSVIIGGHSGTGKSHLAKALILIGCRMGYRCRYTTAANMLFDLKSGLVDDTLEHKLKSYIRPNLLLIDELGFDRIEQDATRPANLFFKVIDARYGKASTILTTNMDFQSLGQYLGDPVMTTAILDRLIHHATVLTIEGPSWRMHQSRLLNQQTQESKQED